MADKVVRKMRTKMRPALELKDVIELLRAEVERAGNQTMFAKKAGVDRAAVNKVLHGRLKPPPKIVRALNLRVVYLPNEPG